MCEYRLFALVVAALRNDRCIGYVITTHMLVKIKHDTGNRIVTLPNTGLFVWFFNPDDLLAEEMRFTNTTAS